MISHVGKRQCSLDMCNKSLINSKNLTVHRCTQTGEKPYDKYLCETVKSKLQFDETTRHAYARKRIPYSVVCNQKFTNNCELAAHLSMYYKVQIIEIKSSYDSSVILLMYQCFCIVVSRY